MSKFVYKMENVLNVKIKLESQAKIAFSVAAENVKEEELKLQKLYDDIYEYENRIREVSKGKLDVQELKRCVESLKIKKIQTNSQQKALNKAKKEMEIARLKLNEIMIDRKTHEKLKEKAIEKYLLEEKSKEIKEIDELVSFSYAIDEKTGE